ncbi:MAG TPA: hypothetical protein VKJ65_06810 [Phycisphaerae bacterium]|nr:hypothetical protein [Phycisphaerae bacterium]
MSKFDEAYEAMQRFGTTFRDRLFDHKVQIDNIRSGKTPVLSGCSSRASHICTHHMAGLKEDLDKIIAAMKDAETGIWKECGAGTNTPN